MPTPLTDADKVIRNDTGLAIVQAIQGISAPAASNVPYDNTTSGLTADDVQDAIDELKSDIDSVELEDLDDVDLTSPQDEDELHYDSATSKWKNIAKKIYEKSASGSLVSFNDGGDNIPLKSLVANITAVQSGSGTPSPDNVRSISGFNEIAVSVIGKNFYPIKVGRDLFADNRGATHTTNDDILTITMASENNSGVYGGTGTATNNTICQTIKKFSGSFVFSLYAKASANNSDVYFGFGSFGNTVATLSTSWQRVELPLTLNSAIHTLNFYNRSGSAITVDVKDVQIEQALSTATTYEAYKGTVVTIPLGDTYYIGYLDVTNGTLTVTHGYIEYDGSSDETWYYSENGSGKKRVYIVLTGCKPSTSNIIANWLTYYGTGAGYPNVNTMQVNSNASPSLLIGVDNNITQASDWATYLSTHTLQVVYELATRVVIKLNKTQVTTLLNENHIYANSGDISLEYFTQSAKDISEVANSSNKMDYSNPTGTGSLSINRKSGTSIGTNSIAIGYNTEASGLGAFSEGRDTSSSGNYAHAEGRETQATHNQTHAEGYQTKAKGNSSHAEGYQTSSNGFASHAEGNGTIAKHKCQHVYGEYNEEDASTATSSNRGNYVEIVGKGTNEENRSNARTLDWSGNETLAGGLKLHTDKDAATLTVSDSIAAGTTYNFANYSDGTVIFVYRPADAGQSDYTGIYIRATNWSTLIPIKAAPNVTISGYVLTNGTSQSLRCAIIST